MSELRVNLYENASSNIRNVMDGPWEDIRVVEFGEDSLLLETSKLEYCGFVISGEIHLRNGDGNTVVLGPDSAFALPKTGKAELSGSIRSQVLLISMRLE